MGQLLEGHPNYRAQGMGRNFSGRRLTDNSTALVPHTTKDQTTEVFSIVFNTLNVKEGSSIAMLGVDTIILSGES